MNFKDFLWNSLFLRNSLTSYVLEYSAFKICKVVSRLWPSLLGSTANLEERNKRKEIFRVRRIQSNKEKDRGSAWTGDGRWQCDEDDDDDGYDDGDADDEDNNASGIGWRKIGRGVTGTPRRRRAAIGSPGKERIIYFTLRQQTMKTMTLMILIVAVSHEAGRDGVKKIRRASIGDPGGEGND
jgi:hypothetical protein